MNKPTFLIATTALLANLAVTDAFTPQSSVSRSPTIIRATSDPEPSAVENKEEEEKPVYFNILTDENPQQTPLVVSTESQFSDAAVAAANKIASSYAQEQVFQPINGWVPKEDYALWGLPGAIPPLGYFDPIGFAREGTPLNDAKRLREAEVQHGRVAMLATVGYFAGEFMDTVGGGPFKISGPANDQLQQVPTIPFAFLTIAIASAELYRAKKGWVEPQFKIGSNTLWTLRDNYYPGDLGFDPLGLKPDENYAFQRMQTKELSNGRLAMLGWAGMCAQELVNHRTIGETWDFYSRLLSGEYDYYY